MPYESFKLNFEVAELLCMRGVEGGATDFYLMFSHTRPEQAITMQREVITTDQWEHFFNNNLVRKDSGWLKNVLSNEESAKTLSEYERKQLHYILSTAPTWDRCVQALLFLPVILVCPLPSSTDVIVIINQVRKFSCYAR